MAAESGAVSSRSVHLAVADLQAYWQKGRDSLNQHGERVKYGESSETLRKSRRFSARYTEPQLQRLIAKCVKHQTPLGISFVDRLVTIENRTERAALETQLIQQGWSLSQLNREIRSRYGSRRSLGRKPHRPTTSDQALSELVRLCLKLTRWGQMMGWQPNTGKISADGESDELTLADLPQDVVAEARSAMRTVLRLQRAAEAEMAKLRKG